MIDSTPDNHGRHHPPGIYLGLKAEFRRLCAAAGTYEAAAGMTRGTTATIYRHGDPVRPDLYPAIDMVADLESATGVAFVTAYLAKLQGYRLEPLTRAEMPTPASADPLAQVLTVMKEVGDYAQAIQRVAAARGCSLNEIDTAIREGHEAIAALQVALDALFALRARKTTETEIGG